MKEQHFSSSLLRLWRIAKQFEFHEDPEVDVCNLMLIILYTKYSSVD